jgi:hypothetical protein
MDLIPLPLAIYSVLCVAALLCTGQGRRLSWTGIIMVAGCLAVTLWVAMKVPSLLVAIGVGA